MTENIRLMSRYNLWADRRLLKTILDQGNTLLDQEVKSSFPTIRQTIGHNYDALKIWLSRLGGSSLDNWPSQGMDQFDIGLLLKESERCLAFVEGLNEQDLNKICTYQDSKGNAYSQPFWQILTHALNHATYHRGQLVTMMRALGVTEIPATDVIYYLREQTD